MKTASGGSWYHGMSPPPWVEPNVFTTDHPAAAFQLVYIARSHGGRTIAEMPFPSGLFPYMSFSHKALAVYLDILIPTRMFVSAADERWKWANDARGYDHGLYTPHYGTGAQNWRHPYRGSFNMGTAFYDVAPVGSRVYQSQYNQVFIPSGSILRQRSLALVAHPSRKILVHDQVARHFGRTLWHMDPGSRAPVLFVDGTAGLRPYSEANLGWDPNQPSGPPLQIIYGPPLFSPDPQPPGGWAIYYGGPFWTRMALQGRDFGGPEVYP